MTEEISEDILATGEANETPETPEAAQPVESTEGKEATFDDRLSSQFAELKRREREISKERQSMKAEVDQQVKKALEAFTQDPVNKLKEYGLSADKLTEGILGTAPEPSADEMTRRELDELKAWKAEQEKSREESKKAQVIKDYQTEVFGLVSKDEEKYKLINTFDGGKDLLWNTIVEYHQEYGEAPDLNDLAKRVEKHIFDHVKKVSSYATEEKPAAPVEPKQEQAAPKSTDDPFTISAQHKSYTAPKVRTVDATSPIQVRSKWSQAQDEAKQRLIDKFLTNK